MIQKIKLQAQYTVSQIYQYRLMANREEGKRHESTTRSELD